MRAERQNTSRIVSMVLKGANKGMERPVHHLLHQTASYRSYDEGRKEGRASSDTRFAPAVPGGELVKRLLRLTGGLVFKEVRA